MPIQFLRRSLPFAVLAALAVGTTGCELIFGPEDGPPEKIEALPRELSLAEQEVIASSNLFALELLRKVYDADTAENVFLSPLSVTMALGMALNGADGETYDAMKTTLGYPGLSQAEINTSYRDLIALLADLDDSVEWVLANSAWSRLGVPFEDAFFTTARDYFDAHVQELDFDAPGAVDVMNDWVSEKTNGRISSIVERIDDTDILFLLNAIYFKGSWTTRFDPGRTGPASFMLDPGEEATVTMMRGDNAILAVGELEDGTRVGELPYGGQAYVMTILLPPDDETLAGFVARLDPQLWDDALASLNYAEDGHVALPRFETTWGASLIPALADMGMGIAFDWTRADFSRLTPVATTHITSMDHKTFLLVNEEGTEAAAATSVGMGAGSAPPGLQVDRSFVVAIRDRLSGTVLFLGAVREPQE